MAKSILLSIKPKYVSLILNEIKTIEIRKRFPSDYVGWVYIYCTKGKLYLFKDLYAEKNGEEKLYYVDNKEHDSWSQKLNGKVVARFWCDKVEEIKFINPNRTCGFSCEISDDDCYYNINEKECCLSQDELFDYLQGNNGYAIHIAKLEIFDKPKEINEFWGIGKKCKFDNMIDREWYCEYCKKPNCIKPLTRAPQSWCYIEV